MPGLRQGQRSREGTLGPATTPGKSKEGMRWPNSLRGLENPAAGGAQAGTVWEQKKCLRGRPRYAWEAATWSPEASVVHENSRMSPRYDVSFTAERAALCCRMFSRPRGSEGKRRLMLRDKRGQSHGLMAEAQAGASHVVMTHGAPVLSPLSSLELSKPPGAQPHFQAKMPKGTE